MEGVGIGVWELLEYLRFGNTQHHFHCSNEGTEWQLQMLRVMMHYHSLSINPEPAMPSALTPRIFSENEARVFNL